MAENDESEPRTRDLIAQAWVALPLLVTGELLLDIVHLSVEGDYSELAAAAETGLFGVIAVMLAGGALLQMAVKAFDHKSFRLAVFVFTLLFVGFVLLHQVGHVKGFLAEGINTHLPFDIALDVIGIWTLFLSGKWAELIKS